MTAHFQIAPDGPFTVGTLTPTTNRGYYGRFIPAGDRVLTAIQFMVASQAPTDVPVSVAGFEIGTDGELARISTSGDVAGRLNVEPTQIDGQNLKKYSIAVPRVLVRGEQAHYAAVRANGNTFQFVSAVLGKDALLECSNSQTVLGLARALEFQAPLSTVIPRPGVAYEVPLMGVSYQRRIVCLGDSITGHPGSDPLLQYPRSLGALLGPHAYVINAGVGSETAAVMLARFGSDVGSNRPLDVIVQAGVNDLAADHSATRIEMDLTALYDAIVALGATPRPVTILPFGGYSSWSATREAIRLEVNDWIKGLGYPYTDVESLGNGASPPTLQTAYSPDELHLSGAGDTELAKLIFAQSFGGSPTAPLTAS